MSGLLGPKKKSDDDFGVGKRADRQVCEFQAVFGGLCRTDFIKTKRVETGKASHEGAKVESPENLMGPQTRTLSDTAVGQLAYDRSFQLLSFAASRLRVSPFTLIRAFPRCASASNCGKNNPHTVMQHPGLADAPAMRPGAKCLTME